MKKITLITGVSRGTGRALAVVLDAWQPAMLNFRRRAEAAQRTPELIQNSGGRNEFCPFAGAVAAACIIGARLNVNGGGHT